MPDQPVGLVNRISDYLQRQVDTLSDIFKKGSLVNAPASADVSDGGINPFNTSSDVENPHIVPGTGTNGGGASGSAPMSATDFLSQVQPMADQNEPISPAISDLTDRSLTKPAAADANLNKSSFGQRMATAAAGGALTKEEYFPSADMSTLKGTVSGDGMNVPIFTPNMLYPYAIGDARAKSLLDASVKATAKQNTMDLKPPSTYAPYQDKVTEGWYGDIQPIIAEAKKKYGNHYVTALKDGTTDVGAKLFLKQSKWNDLAANMTQMTEDAQYYQKLQDSNPNVFISDIAKKTATDWKAGIYGTSVPGNPLDVDQLNKERKAMTAGVNLQKLEDDEYNNMKASMMPIMSTVAKGYIDQDPALKAIYDSGKNPTLEQLQASPYYDDIVQATSTQGLTGDQAARAATRMMLSNYSSIAQIPELNLPETFDINTATKEEKEAYNKTLNMLAADMTDKFGIQFQMENKTPEKHQQTTNVSVNNAPETKDTYTLAGTYDYQLNKSGAKIHAIHGDAVSDEVQKKSTYFNNADLKKFNPDITDAQMGQTGRTQGHLTDVMQVKTLDLFPNSGASPDDMTFVAGVKIPVKGGVASTDDNLLAQLLGDPTGVSYITAVVPLSDDLMQRSGIVVKPLDPGVSTMFYNRDATNSTAPKLNMTPPKYPLPDGQAEQKTQLDKTTGTYWTVRWNYDEGRYQPVAQIK